MHGILNIEKEEKVRDQTLEEWLRTCPPESRRDFHRGMGIVHDSLPTFTGKSGRSAQVLDGHAVDDLMQEAIVRCSIVAPQELVDCETFVRLQEENHSNKLDWGMRFDLMIPALIHTYVRWKTGDRDFWREKKHVAAFIRAFPQAKAHYAKKIHAVPA